MKQKEFFIISLTIFLTVVAWMMADIYHITQREKIKLQNLEMIKSPNYNIDQEIFKILKEKK